MTRMALALAASGFYSIATLLKARHFIQVTSINGWFRGSAFLAIFFQAVLLHLIIDSAAGQNLTFFNLLAQVAWVIAVLSWGLSFWRSLSNLCLLTYPFAIVSIGLALAFPGSNIIVTADKPLELIHILLVITCFSVLCLAGLQALLSVIQERMLAYKEGIALLDSMSPLETTERLLFVLVSIGFVLLSLVLVTSFYFFNNPFSDALLQKTLVTFLTWLSFAVLLMGRYFYGWRGPAAMRWTSFGILLMLSLLASSAFGIRL